MMTYLFSLAIESEQRYNFKPAIVGRSIDNGSILEEKPEKSKRKYDGLRW